MTAGARPRRREPRGADPAPPSRPARGTPEETRRRLLAAAAEVFNLDGYEGTDSNRLARAAGYSPGTFYKHFPDKKAAFLAVYAEWVAEEWQRAEALLEAPGTARERGARTVAMVLEHHARWRGFRASLRRLVATDDAIRAFYQEQRRQQLARLVARRRTDASPSAAREDDALLLFTLERAADALADGEAKALGLDATQLRARLVDLVERRL